MSAPGDELDQFYRQSYRRLMVGSLVTCAVLLLAIAAGQTTIVPTVVRQIVPGYDTINPGPVTRSAPNCRFKKSWSTAAVRRVSATRTDAAVYRADRRQVTLADPGMS